MLGKRGSLIVMAMAMMMIPGIASALEANANVTPYPSGMNVTVNTNETFNISFELSNAFENLNVSNITMNSTYLLSFTPENTTICSSCNQSFVAILEINESYNSTHYLEDTIGIYGIVVNESGIVYNQSLLSSMKINITVNPTEEQRSFFYRKCFIEQDQEYCTFFNITDLVPVNITVINQTNITLNVLSPINLTQQLIDENRENNQKIIENLTAMVNAAQNTSERTQEMLVNMNNMYRNAFYLEGYLKNAKNPTWMQVSPVNTLVNSTGLTYQEFSDALGILIQNSKITQKTEMVTSNIPISNGFMTQTMNVLYIASTERLNEESIVKSSTSTVVLVVVASFVVIIPTVFYFAFWKNRHKGLKI